MKKKGFCFWFGLFSAIAVVIALAGALFVFLEKKKRDEEELERYLDCSIQ